MGHSAVTEQPVVKTKRLNERRSDGGPSRGRPDPDCGRGAGRSGPWRTLSKRASHGLETGAIAPAIAACLARLPGHAHTAQHTWHVSVMESPEVKAHQKPLRRLMRRLIIRQPSCLLPILSSSEDHSIQIIEHRATSFPAPHLHIFNLSSLEELPILYTHFTRSSFELFQ
jgi:hypothetical protein